MTRIEGLDVVDVRFPTSRTLDGSDAMNKDPDYSAAYVTLRTDDGDRGFGLVFTIGRGNEVQSAAIRALDQHVVGLDVQSLEEQPGDLYRAIASDSQLRWLGPEKGVTHMAMGAVVNAAWDLLARRAGKPLWEYLAELSPEQVVGATDFTYLADALTPGEALDLLTAQREGLEERRRVLLAEGHPAYTTSPGWLGYDDDKIARLSAEASNSGFTLIKLKVGEDPADDARRMEIVRSSVPEQVRIALDANQRWEVPQAIEWMRELAHLEPYWIEEPTSPDDILGHAAIRQAIAPVKVASGEHTANRVIFKQLIQAQAIDVVQLDASRVGGINELLAIMLLAAKHDLPVVPHAGGVGLCEIVQHLAMFDSLAISDLRPDRMIEYVDHLHEHSVHPVRIKNGRYLAPRDPGFGAEMKETSIARYRYPDGEYWQANPV